MSKKDAKTQPQNKEQAYEVRDIVLPRSAASPHGPTLLVSSPFPVAFARSTCILMLSMC